MKTLSKLRLFKHRVPVKLQLNAVECGAACLAMILSYYGRETNVAECYELIDIGRDGLTAKSIANLARSYGLRVKAYSLEPSDFKYVQLPAIAHWDFNHFVVVENWSSKKVEIVDPGSGRRQLTAEEFDAGFTGVVLVFEPGVQFQRRHKVAKVSWYNYLILFLQQHPSLLFQIFTTSLLLQFIGLGLPIFTQILVDTVLPLHITSIMGILGIGMVMLLLSQIVTNYLRAALLIYLQARLDARMTLGLFEHLLTLPFRFFEQRTTGDLLMRLGSNVMIRETLTNQVISVLLDGVFVTGYLIILLLKEPIFGITVFAAGLLQVIILFGTNKQVHNLMERDLSAQSDSNSYLVEALTGIETLKASGAENRAFDRWSNLFFQQLNVSLKRSHFSATIDTVMMALRNFSPLVLLWVGGLRVLDGTMSLGVMLALNALAIAFLTPLASLVSTGQQLQMVGAYLQRLTDILTARPEQDLNIVQNAPKLTGKIELQHVSFCYDSNAPLVLQDISLTVEPGQKIAIVGRSGSGKSTLAKLLLGLYVPTSGTILYDNIALEKLNWRTLRSQLGVVLQEPFIFNSSIRENIVLNNPSLSLEQVIQVAKIAAIHKDIVQMPMGYETKLAEGGVGLSGGQRQRLAIARALANQPAILLLDEATSHLDVVTESLVEKNFSHLNCTRIVIAHRLSTVSNADVILVLQKGRIVEQGDHEQLLAQQGYYANLVQSKIKLTTT